MAFGNVDIGVRYIKISKIDENGINQTNSLQELQEITIPFNDIGNKTYKITNIIEYPDYFLYETEAQSGITSQTSSLTYNLTGSLTTSSVLPSVTPSLATIPFSNVTPLSQELTYNDNEEIELNTYPQKPLHLRLTGSATVSNLPCDIGIYKRYNNSTSPTLLVGKKLFVGPNNIDLSYEYTSSTALDSFFIGVNQPQTFPFDSILQLSSTNFLISSSQAISSSITMVIEPYLVSNFSKAYDCQPLLNNAVELRFNKYLQDVDYSSNALVPVNFELLFSGSATRANVPESNYTSLAVTNPRYKGVKNQTEKINEWTDFPLNEGNFGKEPAIDSKIGLVSYCTTAGGLQPDYMDAVEVRIKYIIKNADNVISPNISEGAIGDVQFAYPSRGFVKLIPTENPTDPGKKFEIIRGGQRILPVFYNQSQSLADLDWVDTVEFTNIAGDTDAVVLNKTATLQSTGNTTLSVFTFTTIPFSTILSQGDDITNLPGSQELATTNKYTISQEVIDNVSQLDFNCTILVQVDGNTEVELNLIKNGDISNPVASTTKTFLNADAPMSLNVSLGLTELNAGDIYEYVAIKSFFSTDTKVLASSTWQISQEPYPTAPVSTTNLFFTSSLNPNAIYSTSSLLIQYYGNPSLKQEDIANSGFFSIQFPFKFETGDEVRFEGLERKTFAVINAEVVSGSFPFATSSLNITLDKQISGSGIDVNKFVFRRFIDDGGAITIRLDGKSLPTSPYYAFPEYITDELSVDLDTLTSILVNKGLIT